MGLPKWIGMLGNAWRDSRKEDLDRMYKKAQIENMIQDKKIRQQEADYKYKPVESATIDTPTMFDPRNMSPFGGGNATLDTGVKTGLNALFQAGSLPSFGMKSGPSADNPQQQLPIVTAPPTVNSAMNYLAPSLVPAIEQGMVSVRDVPKATSGMSAFDLEKKREKMDALRKTLEGNVAKDETNLDRAANQRAVSANTLAETNRNNLAREEQAKQNADEKKMEFNLRMDANNAQRAIANATRGAASLAHADQVAWRNQMNQQGLDQRSEKNWQENGKSILDNFRQEASDKVAAASQPYIQNPNLDLAKITPGQSPVDPSIGIQAFKRAKIEQALAIKKASPNTREVQKYVGMAQDPNPDIAAKGLVEFAKTVWPGGMPPDDPLVREIMDRIVNQEHLNDPQFKANYDRLMNPVARVRKK